MRNLIARYQSRRIRGRVAARQRAYVPIPFTPVPPVYDIAPRAVLVRPYVLRIERQRRQVREDRSRLGVAVLLDMARPASVAVAA